MTTNCVLPPELDDKQLLAYLDDRKSNPETAQHMEKCPYCRERAETINRFQQRLTSRLYRITCPSPQDLGEYHLRMLSASQMLLISGHVRECPLCTQEVSQLAGYLSEPSQPSLMERVKVFVAQLVTSGNAAPAFTGLRGADDEPVRYQADDIPIIIGIHDDLEHPGSRMLLGLIPGLNLRGFTIEIHQGEKQITSTLVDEIGNFLFTQLAPGLYDLVLPSLDVEVRIPSVIV